VRLLLHPVGKFAVGASLVLGLVFLSLFSFYYVKFSRLIDRKLRVGPFQSTSMVFAAPRAVAIGDELTAGEVVVQLAQSGYSESSGNRMGWYHLRTDHALEIFPGPDSYFDDEAGVIKFSAGRVVQIISLRDNTDRMEYLLEPELITNLSDRNREKRRIVKFADIPKVLVDAVISVEDKRFFQHAGFDPLRVLKAAYVDLRERRRAEGASTLSMQLARGLWLDQRKTWGRKVAEAMITLHLEQKLSKQEIFEYYANLVPLGRRGSFAINGFGEAARTYFGKDVSRISLPEAATLAGLIQEPSFRNPYRHPDRARDRRNVVLQLMLDNGYIAADQFGKAAAAPLTLAPAEMESTEAPYFVDLVNDQLQGDFPDFDFQNNTYRVYTTVDLNLQHAASEAVRIGMQEVDQRMSRRKWPKGEKPAEAQCALIALDTETGAVKALIGGRDYGASQLDRVLAKRQPGSAFKPFVYAAALNTALAGGRQVFTPATVLRDEPTTFWFDGKPYAPANFKSEYRGQVTIREALAHSLNVPTVELAQAIGYNAVEDLAKRAGLSLSIQATPAIALGAYEVTPLEVAGSYTIFADQGTYVRPNWVSLIRDRKGEVVFNYRPERRQVLDRRVAFLMVSLMEEVLRSGTGAGVHSRGFTLPAAGKTGTSHDGWFVGFTSRLICAVWVGIDDNRELNLEGAHSALPIWAEFMKRAHQYREYRNVKNFAAPDGIVMAEIDPESGQLAMPNCPQTLNEVFISGTQPVETCRLHGGTGATRVASWESQPNEPLAPPRLSPGRSRFANEPPRAEIIMPPAPAVTPQKRGFFRRLFGGLSK
jgi:penicillin-binding protein 1B